MERSRKVYVDTSPLIAICDQSDFWHRRCVELFFDPPPLVTTTAVIIEGHGWFLRRFDSMQAIRFLEFIKSLTIMEVHPVTSSDLLDAEKYLGKFRDHRLTMVDAVGLCFMDRLRLDKVWSTDRHLALTGREIISGA